MNPSDRQSIVLKARNAMTTCEVCGETGHELCFVKNGYEIVRCSNCGFMYVNNPPTKEYLNALYSRPFFEGVSSLFSYVEYERQERSASINARKRWEMIEDLIDGGRVLDVGCAFGSFLNAAPPRWESHGVELSPYAAQLGKDRYGLKIFQGDFLEYDSEGMQFDLITFWDTIEHMFFPLKVVEKASQLMKSGGYLILSTGDVESFFARLLGQRWYLYIPPTHLFFFSADTISRLLRSNGLDLLEITYPGKHVPIKDLVRGLYLLFEKSSSDFLSRLARSSIGNMTVYYNFLDIMTVIAQKNI